MTDLSEKMTIKNLADELGVSKNTVRNQLVNSGFDLAQYKENGIIMLDKELIGVVRSIYRSKSDQLTGQLPANSNNQLTVHTSIQFYRLFLLSNQFYPCHTSLPELPPFSIF